MPKAEKIWLKVRTSDLCRVLGCNPHTLRRLVREGRFKPSSLEDIIDKANNPNQLDRRRK